MQMKPLCHLTLILALLVCNGCFKDNRPKGLPRLYPVTLTITMDGQPLGEAIVMLHAENEADAKWTVASQTDADGKAIIATHGQFRGAPAGKFKVCVSKVEALDDLRGRPQVKDYVDPIFAVHESTPLEIEVSPKGATNITLSVYKPQ